MATTKTYRCEKDEMTIRAQVYTGLTANEGLRVGNEHNITAKTLDWTLQDRIYQVRRLQEKTQKNFAIMLSEIEN